MVDKGEPVPFWLTADEQTHGRGRMDRQWVSAPGNLYSTYVTQPPNALQLLPFAVSLAVYHAIAKHLPPQRQSSIGLKWPNDVLIDEAKTSGILIEQKTLSRHTPLIAIGIGLNIEHAPYIEGRAVTHLTEHGATTTPGEVFNTLCETLSDSLALLESAPHSVIPAWMQHATGIGSPITVRMGSEDLHGTFDHLASDGALMVRLESGAMRTIRTGDIVIKSQ